MSIWGLIVMLVCLFLVVALIAGWRGSEGRLARRQLRQLRTSERRTTNAAAVGEHSRSTVVPEPLGDAAPPGS